jgi:hypothetical protein
MRAIKLEQRKRPMTQCQRDLRRYYFRHMVAEHDRQWLSQTARPMILRWSEARHYWNAATKLAQR